MKTGNGNESQSTSRQGRVSYPISMGLIVEGYFSERQHQQVDQLKEIVKEVESDDMTVSDLMASLEDVEYD